MNILDQPLHADGLSTTQLLLPGLIELGNDFLRFLLVKLGEISKNCTHLSWNYWLCSFLDLSSAFPPDFTDFSLIFSSPTILFVQTSTYVNFHFRILHPEQVHHHPSYLEPLDGLFAGWAEDAIVKVVDGPGATGQGRERGRGAHSRHGVGHCGEITPLIDSLAIVHKVLVIAQVCQRERRCMEESK